jgi:hypothetical protein
MNQLNVGFTKTISPPKGGYLLIDDEVPDLKRARVFDPLKHSFNPLKDIDYKKAREIAGIFYAASPQGENTLTVRNGRRALLRMLLDGADRLDKLRPTRGKADPGEVEAIDTVNDVLLSPILRRVLCNPTNFSFNGNSVILVPLNRAKLGEFDALVLGLFLMAHYKGQLIVPDLGFYGRDAHVSLIREGRLIAGVNYLAELQPKLRYAVLLIEDKEGSGTTFEDAEVLAKYRGLREDRNREDNDYNRFLREVMN